MIIDCISDLHGFYPTLEGGDLLIVAGDLTARDTKEEHIEFSAWLSNQDYPHKVVIAGNHDNKLILLGGPIKAPHVDYLLDSGTEFALWPELPTASPENEGKIFERQKVKIWGSPWTLKFPRMNPNCMAFTCDTEEELAEKWKLIPEDIDILITHSPPYGILDHISTYLYTPDGNGLRAHQYLGSKSLADKMEKLRPKLHCFGHIHENGGHMITYGSTTICINASIVNEHYKPVNKPIRVIL